jgi:hypothetical protein
MVIISEEAFPEGQKMALVPTMTFPKEPRDTGVSLIVIGAAPGSTVSVVNMMGYDIVSKFLQESILKRKGELRSSS